MSIVFESNVGLFELVDQLKRQELNNSRHIVDTMFEELTAIIEKTLTSSIRWNGFGMVRCQIVRKDGFEAGREPQNGNFTVSRAFFPRPI